ncbi:hypothetical protein KBB96_02660 [Luteolibacter ambystomatis]|uniref:Uncharacterized protein n=1 Tax=Luteolibacter ambystomatis TaxID=2824561 RepID=A0A975J0J6_9BACT|nr:hypothetical protein [Luteolibacter ambystomatis]QUE51800.1 hypothetical protein KBB96_02660 [Luteolibacter ambystomatis]
MESYRKRLLTARLVLGCGFLLAVAAQWPPLVVFRLSGLAQRYGTVVEDVTIRVWEVLWQLGGTLGQDLRNGNWASLGILLGWFSLFAFLASSPWLAGFYAKAAALRRIARTMAVTLWLSLTVLAVAIGKAAGPGLWLFVASLAIHAAGLFMIPRAHAQEMEMPSGEA